MAQRRVGPMSTEASTSDTRQTPAYHRLYWLPEEILPSVPVAYNPEDAFSLFIRDRRCRLLEAMKAVAPEMTSELHSKIFFRFQALLSAAGIDRSTDTLERIWTSTSGMEILDTPTWKAELFLFQAAIGWSHRFYSTIMEFKPRPWLIEACWRGGVFQMHTNRYQYQYQANGFAENLPLGRTVNLRFAAKSGNLRWSPGSTTNKGSLGMCVKSSIASAGKSFVQSDRLACESYLRIAHAAGPAHLSTTNGSRYGFAVGSHIAVSRRDIARRSGRD